MNPNLAFLASVAIFCLLLIAAALIAGWRPRRQRRRPLPPPSRDCRRSPVVGEALSGWKMDRRS